MPRYFTRSTLLPRIKPSDQIGVAGIQLGPEGGSPLVGIAYATGHVGGFGEVFDGPHGDWRLDSMDQGKPETTWRLVVNKVEVEGRFVLRAGEFIELAEDVE